MATVNRVERKPERNNKIYVKRVSPGINMPKPVNVNPQYVFKENKKTVSEKQIVVPEKQAEIEVKEETPQIKKPKTKKTDDTSSITE
jgi:hypothetical protein